MPLGVPFQEGSGISRCINGDVRKLRYRRHGNHGAIRENEIDSGRTIRKKLETTEEPGAGRCSEWRPLRYRPSSWPPSDKTVRIAGPTMAAAKYIGFCSRFSASTSVTPRDFHSERSNAYCSSVVATMSTTSISEILTPSPAPSFRPYQPDRPESVSPSSLDDAWAPAEPRIGPSGYTIRFGFLPRVREGDGRDRTLKRSRFFLISIPWRLIFWFSVDSGIAEIVGRFSLAPAATFEHLDDDALFERIHDVEERTALGKGKEDSVANREDGEVSTPAVRSRPIMSPCDKHNGAFDDVFQFSNIAGQW